MAAKITSRSAMRGLLAICMLVLATSVFADSPPESAVIRVSKNSAQYLAPYHYGSIQAAINDLPSELTTATVILVYPGTYEESVTIDRRNLSIVGVEPGAVVLSASGTTSTLTVSLPVGSAGDVNTIASLRITHDGTSGGVPVRVDGINATGGLDLDLLIRDCKIESEGGDAITWSAAGRTILADCDLAGSGRVIYSTSVPAGGKMAIRESRSLLTSSATGGSALVADEMIDARDVVFSVGNAGTHSSLTAFSGASSAGVTVAVGTVLDGMTWGDGVVFLNVDAGPDSNLNADYLDSLDSTQFLRSDAADTASGDITFSGALLSPDSGADSFKAGTAASANGFRSVAIGRAAYANSDYGMAVGGDSSAGTQGTALGYSSSAAGIQSVAIGFIATADADYSLALGGASSASGSATAVGRDSNASGAASVALGSGATASGNRGIAAGNSSTASGDYGIALGWLSKALYAHSFAIGQGVETTANYEVRLGGTSHKVSIPGKLGVGIVTPGEKLEVYNGAISIGADSYSTPTAQAGHAKFFVNQDEDNASVTAMWVIDSAGNTTQLSSHADPTSLAASSGRSASVSSFADPNVDLPWSFHHANRLTGEAAIVDMAKLVQWVEQKMQAEGSGDKLVYRYDLPEEKIISQEDWEVQAFLGAVERELRKVPWVQVPLQAGNAIPSEAFEAVVEYRNVETEEAYTDYVVDAETRTLLAVEKTRTVTQQIPTGRMVDRLKPNYRVMDGQLVRQRTIDDLDLSAITIPELPEWIQDRIAPKD